MKIWLGIWLNIVNKNHIL